MHSNGLDPGTAFGSEAGAVHRLSAARARRIEGYLSSTFVIAPVVIRGLPAVEPGDATNEVARAHLASAAAQLIGASGEVMWPDSADRGDRPTAPV